jgi:hypothetical protein
MNQAEKMREADPWFDMMIMEARRKQNLPYEEYKIMN